MGRSLPHCTARWGGWCLQQIWNRVDHDEIHPALPCAGPSRRSGSTGNHKTFLDT